MHTSTTPPREPATNPNVDEYLRQEGLTDEEWKRIYDLRYCTILVPFEEDPDNQEKVQDQDEDEEVSEEETFEEPQPSTPITNRRQGQQLATPKTPRQRKRSPANGKQAKALERHRAALRPTGLLTPQEKRPADILTPLEKQPPKASTYDIVARLNVGISEDQVDDFNDDDTCFLTESDPLATYLTTAHTGERLSEQQTIQNSTDLTTWTVDSDEMDITEPETFHDALDRHDESEAESQAEQWRDVAESAGPSSRAGIKRRRWELEPSSRLLQQRQPISSKRVAILASAFTSKTTMLSTGLMKPRTFTPTSTLTPTSAMMLRRDSTASDVSTISYTSFNQTTLWSTQDWRALEQVYNDMDGSSLAETNLAPVVDRFLTEQEEQAGEKPIWTREKVLTRCVALHRVRNDNRRAMDHTQTGKISGREMTPLSTGPRSLHRHLNRPYPVYGSRGSSAGSSTQGTSSSAVSDFLSHRRADRTQRQRAEDQNYQLKSVFKHRLASGLRTVGHLLPFWRDVEQGNASIKEKVAVPLVPAGRAQAVIEAFETQSQESERAGSVTFSRAGSVVSQDRTNSPSASSQNGQETIADMLARGHSARSSSASSQGSSPSSLSHRPIA
ncbi:hypothetical protein EDD21DRAFT_400312 [Dissophora ornata]|nr:hypothetical protein BGZ58_009522 [Dissophora ornata]KAI8606592.1 hypothetical protein EDD21DRAFT_400312 [Dissophora ornata]